MISERNISLDPEEMDRRSGLLLGASAAAIAGTMGNTGVADAQPRTSDIVLMNGVELSAAIKAKRLSCAEVMNAYLDHIARLNPKVNAIVSLRDRDDILNEAREKDAQLARGQYQGWMH